MLRSESGTAYFSPDRVYRYWLIRDWSAEERRCMWIGLNPSTADEHRLDPTLRRIYDFSKLWGYTGFVMTNLFAFRATIPRVMKLNPEPIGPDNDTHLLEIAEGVDRIMCVWGTDGVHRNRSQEVVAMLTKAGHGSKLHALRITKGGEPGHPLYIRKSAGPLPYLAR